MKVFCTITGIPSTMQFWMTMCGTFVIYWWLQIQYIPLSSNPQGKLKNVRDKPSWPINFQVKFYKWDISKCSSNPKVQVIPVRANRDTLYFNYLLQEWVAPFCEGLLLHMVRYKIGVGGHWWCGDAVLRTLQILWICIPRYISSHIFA